MSNAYYNIRVFLAARRTPHKMIAQRWWCPYVSARANGNGEINIDHVFRIIPCQYGVQSNSMGFVALADTKSNGHVRRLYRTHVNRAAHHLNVVPQLKPMAFYRFDATERSILDIVWAAEKKPGELIVNYCLSDPIKANAGPMFGHSFYDFYYYYCYCYCHGKWLTPSVDFIRI